MPTTVKFESMALAAAVCVVAVLFALPSRAAPPSAERGKYIFDAGGCASCHTDEKGGGKALAGGPVLKTPFGTFYAPNITPDPDFGIGRWTDAQFLNSMRNGIGPDSRQLYPVFPYTSFTKASEQDLLDLKAYLASLAPVRQQSRAHELRFPFSIRASLLVWKWLNFTPGEWRPDASHDATWNRGAYLVEAIVHCGECHTPRDALGGLDRKRWMAGAAMSTSDLKAPNLTGGPDGLSDWTADDIAFGLELGTTPDNEAMSGEMAEVVRNSTSHLTAQDRQAIAAYIKALPPLPNAAPPSGH